jgi:hypothetical protein
MGPGPTGKQGRVGPDGFGITGHTGYTGPTGPTGYIGASSRGDTGPPGTNIRDARNNKTFIIEHPNDQDKYLVHACIEGPEAGVFYRGQGEITNNHNAVVYLPDYTKNLAFDFTIYVNAIYDGTIKMYNFTEIENNSFQVYGENGKFNWLVIGKQYNIDVEPLKENIIIRGNGPYRWN